MNWKKMEGSDVLMFDSKAIDSEALATDIAEALIDIKSSGRITATQMLFYIDGTNGHIFISGVNLKTNEVFDDLGFWIGTQELWEDNTNGYDFDVFVINGILQAMKTRQGQNLLSEFKVYYQTESDSPVRITGKEQFLQ